MQLLKTLFKTKEPPINTYSAFWQWFQQNEKAFFQVVKQRRNIESNFFNKLAPKLNELKTGIYFLTGMNDENTVELILTPDGNIKNIIFVEELVEAAPKIDGWKFTALKPAIDIDDLGIKMGGFSFDKHNLAFYSTENESYPDEIDVTLVYDEYHEKDKSTIMNGALIFLDNYLGELKSVTAIDHLNIIGKSDAPNDVVPMAKLKDYLVWREKEFREKYEGTRYNTEEDAYTNLEAMQEDGKPLIATVDSTLLDWDGKASHPWVLSVELKYDGAQDNGMPGEEEHKILEQIENEIMDQLKDYEGYLYVGRLTGGGARDIYFACKDFRKPAKVLHKVQSQYSARTPIAFDIYKDKYWRSFERFRIEL